MRGVALGLLLVLCGLVAGAPPCLGGRTSRPSNSSAPGPGRGRDDEEDRRGLQQGARCHQGESHHAALRAGVRHVHHSGQREEGAGCGGGPGPRAPQLRRTGHPAPLNSFIEHRTAIRYQDFSKRTLEMASYKNFLYGLPWMSTCMGSSTTRRRWRRRGSRPPGDLTGKEFLRSPGGSPSTRGQPSGEAGFDAKNVVQYAVNMYTNHHAYLMWYGLYSQFEGGGKIISDDQKSCAMDLDKAARAWKWLQDLVYVNQVAPQGSRTSRATSSTGERPCCSTAPGASTTCGGRRARRD